MTSITIPNNVTSIGENAFTGTAWFESQPEGVVYAGAFLYTYKGMMPANTSIDIKEGTILICDVAFRNCSGLVSITIPNSVTIIGEKAFSGCNNLSSIIIPNSTTHIGEYAFELCQGLTSFVISKTVRTIEQYAFYYCTNLHDVYCYTEEIPNIGDRIFYYTDIGNATLHVPATSIEAYRNARQWNSFGNIVALTDSDPLGKQDIVIGDANGDNEVNITDITYIIDKINDKPATDFNEKAADLNEDGEINITDVTLLLDKINGCDK